MKTPGKIAFFLINILLPLCFFAGLFFFLGKVAYYHFLGIEQSSFFTNTNEYYRTFVSYPGGLLRYADAYLVQTYNSPWLGAALACGLLFAVFLILRTYIVRITFERSGIATFAALVPTMLLAFLICSPFYQLFEVLCIFIILSAALILTYLNKPFCRLLLELVFIGVLYVLCGAFVYIFVLLAMLTEWMKAGKLNWRMLVLLLFAFLVPFVSRFSLFYMTNKEAYLSGLPYELGHFQLDFGYVLADFMVYVLLGFFLLLALFIGVYGKRQKTFNIFVQITAIILLCIAFGFSLQKWGISSDQLTFEEVNYHAEQENWEHVFDVCEAYFSGEKSKSDGYYPYWLQEYTKLSALMTRNLPEKFTRFVNQLGFGTFFIWDRSFGPRFTFFESDFYYNTGMATMARQIVSGIMEKQNLSNRALRQMIKCNLVIEDSLFNKKYTYIIERTPNNKDFVTTLKDDPTYLPGKRKLLANNSFEDVNSLDMNLLSVVDYTPQNPYIFEFASMLHLLYFQDESYLLENLHRFKALDYEFIPTYFEEALIAHEMLGQEDPFSTDFLRDKDFGGFTIRETTLEKYRNFLTTLNSGIVNLKKVENLYGDTYYFYKLFKEVSI